jgi:flagellar protein FlaG
MVSRISLELFNISLNSGDFYPIIRINPILSEVDVQMNVQFSLSASTSSTSIKNDVITSAAGSSAVLPQINDTKDMARMENQGVRLTVGQEQIIRNIERAVKSLQGPQTTLDISIHDKTHDIMVKVLNKDTGEIIREIPPEKTLDLVAKMMELAGILVDERI